MNENLIKLIKNPWTTRAAIGITAFGSGVIVGYFLGRRRDFEFDPESEQLELNFEIKESFTEQMNTNGITPVVIDQEAYAAIIEQHQAVVVEIIPEAEPDPGPDVVTTSIFAGDDEDWDYEQEVRNRGNMAPFVLHKDEFYAEELGYTQTTLTYYEGDDIMVDQEEAPVYNYHLVTGPLRFGHGSGGDPNVFYVRNHKNKAEYEIIHDSGMYSREVLGLEIDPNERVKDIQHSGLRRFRPE